MGMPAMFSSWPAGFRRPSEWPLRPWLPPRCSCAEDRRARKDPRRNSAEARYRLQGASALVKIERAQILANNLGHGHAQGRGEILLRHFLQPFWMVEKQVQLGRQAFCVAGFVEFDCDAFIARHIAKVVDSRRYYGDAEFARQVRHTAGAGGRRIWQHQHTGLAEQLRNVVFLHVAGEFNDGDCLSSVPLLIRCNRES